MFTSTISLIRFLFGFKCARFLCHLTCVILTGSGHHYTGRPAENNKFSRLVTQRKTDKKAWGGGMRSTSCMLWFQIDDIVQVITCPLCTCVTRRPARTYSERVYKFTPLTSSQHLVYGCYNSPTPLWYVAVFLLSFNTMTQSTCLTWVCL